MLPVAPLSFPTMSSTLLKLQIGPVQEFIAQARSTRDLWSGSYLLSWLIGHAIQVVWQNRPDVELIFPDVSAQPLLRFLESRRHLTDTDEQVLTPNLPNLFLAWLPCDENASQALAKEAERVFDPDPAVGEWGKIAAESLRFLNENGTSFNPDQLDRWALQVSRMWHVTWQVWPWESHGQRLEGLSKHVPMLHNSPKSGDAWNENYQLVSHRLDARRQTRDFLAWEGWATVHKDHFSGRDEAIVDRDWINVARGTRDDRGLRFLFRADDALGANNLIKRVWHKAYLDRVKHLRRTRLAFDSVPDVAAAPFRQSIVDLLGHSRTTFETVRAFQNAVANARDLLEPELRSRVPIPTDQAVDTWLAGVDQSIFNESTWDFSSGTLSPDDQRRADAVHLNMRAMIHELKLREPGRYYAVVALDGDDMGRWVSGEKTGGTTKQRHQEFSAKLSQFALNDARAFVEEHNGVLIYSGGDDVLAMVPATEALSCVKALLDAFRRIEVQGGNLTASAGVAIGHIKAPLQDMIEAAQNAEKAAKRNSELNGRTWSEEDDPWDWPQALADPAQANQRVAKVPRQDRGFGRDAVAVTLFKRSGEIVEWGAKSGSPAWQLLSFYQRHSRPSLDTSEALPPITGRFPHSLAELLMRYGTACLNPKNKGIILKELNTVITQQTQIGRGIADAATLAGVRSELLELCTAYLDSLAVNRRPITEFLHLFTTEAFVARQGD